MLPKRGRLPTEVTLLDLAIGVLLPPNSQANEVIPIQAQIRSTGYSGPIARSNIYVAPVFNIVRKTPVAERLYSRNNRISALRR